MSHTAVAAVSKSSTSSATEKFHEALVEAYNKEYNKKQPKYVSQDELPGPKSKKAYDDAYAFADDEGTSAVEFKLGEQTWYAVTGDNSGNGDTKFYSKNDKLGYTFSFDEV